MKKYENIIGQFAFMWNFCTGRELPGLNKEEKIQNFPPLGRAMIPVTGFVLGLCLIVLLFLAGIFGRIPQTVVAGI